MLYTSQYTTSGGIVGRPSVQRQQNSYNSYKKTVADMEDPSPKTSVG